MTEKPDDKLIALPGQVARLRLELKETGPQELADRTGAVFTPASEGTGVFHLPLWGQAVQIDYPGFTARSLETGKELSIDQQALLLFYFRHAQGGGQDRRWISFSELPEGKFYNTAFQGYSGSMLAQTFKEDRAAFEAAAGRLAGQKVELGQAAYAFQVLPLVSLGVVYWEGDEDFPAAMQVLFDSAAARHLPTDVCAIAGGMLARRLMKAGAA
jgi:hypothetical protein